jgi:hypothetical protein
MINKFSIVDSLNKGLVELDENSGVIFIRKSKRGLHPCFSVHLPENNWERAFCFHESNRSIKSHHIDLDFKEVEPFIPKIKEIL